jgi:PhzF family phenazine biosynthesis protein
VDSETDSVVEASAMMATAAAAPKRRVVFTIVFSKVRFQEASPPTRMEIARDAGPKRVILRAWGPWLWPHPAWKAQMKLKLWQIDAFAKKPFRGNPAAIVPLEQWLPDATLQAIANENNLAETAFFVARETGFYDLRWFTPTVEVPLCGHATLASAWVVFSELAPALNRVRFATKSGVMTVDKGDGGLHRMAMPAGRVEPFSAPKGLAQALGESLGVPPPDEILFAPTGAGGTPAPLAVWAETAIRTMRYSDTLSAALAHAGAGALLATGKGDGKPYDYVARFFAPGLGVPEDPVTGSMNCTLVPFWAKRLGKRTLRAYQASPRGGDLLCTDDGEQVILSGPCAPYLKGEIEI